MDTAGTTTVAKASDKASRQLLETSSLYDLGMYVLSLYERLVRNVTTSLLENAICLWEN